MAVGDEDVKSTKSDSSSRTPEPWENSNHAIYLHHLDQPGAVLVAQPLIEDNFNEWTSSMSMALKIKNNLVLFSGSDTVTMFFTKLKSLWDERDTICDLQACNCAEGAKVGEYIKNLKTMQFIMGLNANYDTVRGNIVSLDPLPSVNKVYSMALRHEKQATASNNSKVVSHLLSPCKNKLPVKVSRKIVILGVTLDVKSAARAM
ncbi:hypothetical protein ACLB2K_018205 [Fragaria x ananassa]